MIVANYSQSKCDLTWVTQVGWDGFQLQIPTGFLGTWINCQDDKMLSCSYTRTFSIFCTLQKSVRYLDFLSIISK